MNERLKKVRKALKMTQTDFGRRVGVAAAAISKIENGENSLTEQMILSICREFNVCEEWLREGIGGDAGMFELYDDKELYDLFSRYNMDNNSRDIIKSYVKLHQNNRMMLSGLIKEFARSILDNPIESTKSDLFNEFLNHFPGTLSEHQTNSIVKKINGAFGENLPLVSLHDPPLKPPIDEEYADEALHSHKRGFDDIEYMRSVLDAQQDIDEKYNKKGNDAK